MGDGESYNGKIGIGRRASVHFSATKAQLKFDKTILNHQKRSILA